jgi:hypothetical protein
MQDNVVPGGLMISTGRDVALFLRALESIANYDIWVGVKFTIANFLE